MKRFSIKEGLIFLIVFIAILATFIAIVIPAYPHIFENAVLMYSVTPENAIIVNPDMPFAVNFSIIANTKQIIVNVEGTGVTYRWGRLLESNIVATLNGIPMHSGLISQSLWGESVQFRTDVFAENNTLEIFPVQSSATITKLEVFAIPS